MKSQCLPPPPGTVASTPRQLEARMDKGKALRMSRKPVNSEEVRLIDWASTLWTCKMCRCAHEP
eukprot:144947-Amorphochlora_amoeboformis.AAC.1